MYQRMKWTIPAFAFQAEAATHIYRPRRDGELSWFRHHHGEQTGPLRDGDRS